MDERVLVVAGSDGAEFPVGKAFERGEFVVADDEHFDTLGLVERLLDVLGDGGELEVAEVDLDGLLVAPLLLKPLVNLLDQFVAHTI